MRTAELPIASRTTRRSLLREALLPAALGATLVASGCSDPKAVDSSIQWRMKCAWSETMPGMFESAQRLVAKINQQTVGRLKINLQAAPEVPVDNPELAELALLETFALFDQVASGEFQMGHSSPQFWLGKSVACSFFAGAPFGMTGQELNNWLLAGGGLKLWRELYGHFGLLPFPAGNLGAQMTGWFSREIRSLRNLRGLKIRCTGLSAEIWQKLGAIPVSLPGVSMLSAFNEQEIDAAEWMGPWQDLQIGLHQAARHYYFPGWQEPGSNLECMINKVAFDALPADLQSIIEAACLAAATEETALNSVRNQQALLSLVGTHKINVRKLPQDVIVALSNASNSVLARTVELDSFAKRVFESWSEFREQARQWQQIGDAAFVNARS